MAKNLTIADVEFEKEYYGIAFRKAADGKYNALTDLVNQVLVELKDSKKYAEIAGEYGISAATLDLTYTAPSGEADNTELDYIKNKGKIVIGFTLNAPMALGSGDKTTGGFDTDLAKAVFAKSARKSASQSRSNSNLSIGARRNPKWKQKPSTAYGTV